MIILTDTKQKGKTKMMTKGYTVEELKSMVVARLEHIDHVREDEFHLPIARDLVIVFKIKKEMTVYGRLTHDIYTRLFGQDDVAEAFIKILKKTAKEEPVMMHGLHGVVSGMLGVEEEEDADTVVVVSNEDMMFGAIAILYEGVVEKLCERLDTHKLIMIPSSIHEVIVMPYSDEAAEGINSMIREINTTQVDECDRLSDHAYVIDYDEIEFYSLND